MSDVVVGVSKETFEQLTKDALAFRILLSMCRTMVSGDFAERFAIGTNSDGEVVYRWNETDASPRVTWTPAGTLSDVEKSLMASGYGAMVLFPTVLANFDVEPNAMHAVSERLLMIHGPLLGCVRVDR